MLSLRQPVVTSPIEFEVHDLFRSRTELPAVVASRRFQRGWPLVLPPPLGLVEPSVGYKVRRVIMLRLASLA